MRLGCVFLAGKHPTRPVSPVAGVSIGIIPVDVQIIAAYWDSQPKNPYFTKACSTFPCGKPIKIESRNRQLAFVNRRHDRPELIRKWEFFMGNKNNKANQKSSLPPLLPGSEYKTANSNICRTVNLLGQAIAIVVYAGDGKRSKSDKEALLKLFEQECKKVINRSTVSWHFSQIQAWLKASLSGKPDWHELYKLADHQLILCKKDDTKWWDDVKSICGDPDAGTNAYDPVPDILRISQKYGKKKSQHGAPPTGRKHGKDKLNKKVKNLLEKHPDWKAHEIAEKIYETPSTTDSMIHCIIGTEAWKENRKCLRERSRRRKNKKSSKKTEIFSSL